MKTISKQVSAKIDTPAILLDWEQVQTDVNSMAHLCAANGIQMMPHQSACKQSEDEDCVGRFRDYLDVIDPKKMS